ncbi:hypothetical protein BOTBODRAFT_376535 [Botryobasidium botryosum FD-172 SS1]|uniref:HORMA domain-containing protein n=1 Tax=Botryobasidium botryosum (strain FD-172 SS1) TaxID=930990 RepID=A0A067MYJ7_BOTB1|nr:hypothetical protein BOTBODRAFT_376535 [Botryobasidium botryosum FD-172 SS1]
MQQQETQVSSRQSLEVVQALIKSAFGCITYLRGLLPDDNFQDGCLSASDDSSCFLSGELGASSRSHNQMKVKVVKKGFSTEADQLLNYLEGGIFDALEKQYLRSFVFAIYLDPDDPNNIIEAYTFSFAYCNVPGTDVTVPIMSIDSRARSLSVGSMNPKSPSLREVKASVKTLVRNLISFTQMMEVLPKQRYANFKVFYYDHTPEDYEPPYFVAGDSTKDKFFFTTHSPEEKVEKMSTGTVSTPFHAVGLHVASIASIIPSAQDDSGTFAGMATSSKSKSALASAAEEEASRAEEAESQARDAELRKVVWNADLPANSLLDMDLEEEPLGVRDDEGNVVTIDPASKCEIAEGEHMYSGVEESIPANAHVANEFSHLLDEQGGSTQVMETQPIEQSSSPMAPPLEDPSEDILSMIGLQRLTIEEVIPDSQPSVSPGSAVKAEPTTPAKQTSAASGAGKRVTRSKAQKAAEDVVECDCGVQTEDEACCLCEAGCNRWFHVWCMGYHSADDSRFPEAFSCFHCRVRDDPNSGLLTEEQIEEKVTKLKELALFRKAIKIVTVEGLPATSVAFKKRLGVELAVASQIWKRLEVEGFIAAEDSQAEIQTTTKARTKTRRAHKKVKMVVVKTRGARLVLEKYFQPGGDVEAELLGLATLVGAKLPPHTETITAGPELSQSQSSAESIEVPTPPETAEMSPVPILYRSFRVLTPL